mgnify:CR=1 FL=1
MQAEIEALAQRPDARAILAAWPHLADAILEEALAIQAIPAPTFAEAARAQYVAARFREIGLADVAQDSLGNVYARTPAVGPSRLGVIVSAHLDTVFPASTDLTILRDTGDGRVYAPGLGDNSLSLAAMLALAAQLQARDVHPAADIWWVATVGEEGLGDLRGMRAALKRLYGRVGLGLVLEGIGLGHIYHAGLGVRRLRVSVRGPGGHSWLHPEPPNAIHQLVRIAEALVREIQPPVEPRSTFNIGLIEGGTSVNTRAAHASLSIDLRSVDAGVLARLEAEVRSVVSRFAGTPDLSVSIEVIGDRPSAALSIRHPLVRAARAVLERLGWESPVTAIGSTDANVLLAARIPAVCVGITTGGNVHTTEEYIDTGPVATGMSQITLLVLLAAAYADEWRVWQGAGELRSLSPSRSASPAQGQAES